MSFLHWKLKKLSSTREVSRVNVRLGGFRPTNMVFWGRVCKDKRAGFVRR
jgi:hypothetical protein